MVAERFALPVKLKMLWRMDRRAALHEGLLLLLAAGFVVSPEPIWSDFYYSLLLPLALYVAWHNRRSFQLRQVPLPLLLASLLMLWYTCTLLWNNSVPVGIPHKSSQLWLWNAVCTFVFVHGLNDALRTGAAFRRRLMRAFVAAGMVNSLIAFVRLPFIASGLWAAGDLRMPGWAETRHPILGAIIMGIVVLMALDRACRKGDWRYWPAAFTGLVFIGLTGSRGPEIAIIVSIVVLLGWSRPRLLVLLIAALLLILAIIHLADSALLAHVLDAQLARGDSLRFAIWHIAWQAIKGSIWVGHGPSYIIVCPANTCEAFPYFTFPHDLFLSTWLYAGIVGVVLLICYLVSTVCFGLMAPDRASRAFNLSLILFILISATTDYSQVIKGPGPVWYIFWLPTLLAAAPIGVGERVLPEIRARSDPRPDITGLSGSGAKIGARLR